MRYILSMSSEEFGSEDFGPYDTMMDALLAQKSILAKAGQLKDGVKRFFAIGLADDEQLPESISDDGSIAIQNPPENFDHDPRFDEGGEFHKEANPTTSTPNGFDPLWIKAINEVLNDRETGLVIKDIQQELWDRHIGPMIDAIEEDELQEDLVEFES